MEQLSSQTRLSIASMIFGEELSYLNTLQEIKNWDPIQCRMGKHRDKIMPHGVDIPHLHRTLIPLAAIYSAVVTVRNKLFDRKLLPVEEFPVPVISVGNLTVGGTGKTPHIEWLTAWLSQHYRVAILSRGYRRKSHGFLLADENSTAALIGDEPYQIHRKISPCHSSRRRQPPTRNHSSAISRPFLTSHITRRRLPAPLRASLHLQLY